MKQIVLTSPSPFSRAYQIIANRLQFWVASADPTCRTIDEFLRIFGVASEKADTSPIKELLARPAVALLAVHSAAYCAAVVGSQVESLTDPSLGELYYDYLDKWAVDPSRIPEPAMYVLGNSLMVAMQTVGVGGTGKLAFAGSGMFALGTCWDDIEPAGQSLLRLVAYAAARSLRETVSGALTF